MASDSDLAGGFRGAKRKSHEFVIAVRCLVATPHPWKPYRNTVTMTFIEV